MNSCAPKYTFLSSTPLWLNSGGRFSANNIAMLHAVCALMPGSDNFLDADILQPMAALQIQHR